jgi:hypothetical protein
VGAGTQALTQAPITLLAGAPAGTLKALMMAGAWLLNLAIAEWIIRRRPVPATRHRPASAPA